MVEQTIKPDYLNDQTMELKTQPEQFASVTNTLNKYNADNNIKFGKDAEELELATPGYMAKRNQGLANLISNNATSQEEANKMLGTYFNGQTIAGSKLAGAGTNDWTNTIKDISGLIKVPTATTPTATGVPTTATTPTATGVPTTSAVTIGQEGVNATNAYNNQLNAIGTKGAYDLKALQDKAVANKSQLDVTNAQNKDQYLNADEIYKKNQTLSEAVNKGNTDANSLKTATGLDDETINAFLSGKMSNLLKVNMENENIKNTLAPSTNTLNDLNLQHNRNAADLDAQVSNTKMNQQNQLDNVIKQQTAAQNSANMQGALTGNYANSGFVQGLKTIKDDNTNILDNLKANYDYNNSHTNELKNRELQNYTTNFQRSTTNYNNVYKQIQQSGLSFLQNLQNSYGINTQEFTNNFNKLNSQINADKSKADTEYVQTLTLLNKQSQDNIKAITDYNKTLQTARTQTYKDLTLNGGSALLNLTPTQLKARVGTEGADSISPTDYDSLLSSMKYGAINTLSDIGTLTADDVKKVGALIDGGSSPMQAITELMKTGRFKKATKPIEVSAGATLYDPVSGKPLYTAPKQYAPTATSTTTSNVINQPNTTSSIDLQGNDVKALMKGTTEDGNKFFGIYMSDPKGADRVTSIYNSYKSSNTPVSEILDLAGSPITEEQVNTSANKYGVDPYLMLSVMQNDSGLGTKGRGADTMNPGNVGNTATGTVKYNSREEGLDALASNLSNRINAYTKATGKGQTTTTDPLDGLYKTYDTKSTLPSATTLKAYGLNGQQFLQKYQDWAKNKPVDTKSSGTSNGSPELMSLYKNYMENGNFPTQGHLAGLGIDEAQFTKDAENQYKKAKTDEYANKGFSIVNPTTFLNIDKSERGKLDTSIDLSQKFLNDFDSTYNKLKEGGVEAQGFFGRGRELEQDVKNLQLQAKEIYNLGVLNGPDLALMESIIPNLSNPATAAIYAMNKDSILKSFENARSKFINGVNVKAKNLGLSLMKEGETTTPTQSSANTSGKTVDNLR